MSLPYKILHISDLHFCHDSLTEITNNIKEAMNELVGKLVPADIAKEFSLDIIKANIGIQPQLIDMINEIDPDIVCISGDITTFGDIGSFDLAVHFLQSIRNKKGNGVERIFVIVPGNHDYLWFYSMQNKNNLNDLIAFKWKNYIRSIFIRLALSLFFRKPMIKFTKALKQLMHSAEEYCDKLSIIEFKKLILDDYGYCYKLFDKGYFNEISKDEFNKIKDVAYTYFKKLIPKGLITKSINDLQLHPKNIYNKSTNNEFKELIKNAMINSKILTEVDLNVLQRDYKDYCKYLSSKKDIIYNRFIEILICDGFKLEKNGCSIKNGNYYINIAAFDSTSDKYLTMNRGKWNYSNQKGYFQSNVDEPSVNIVMLHHNMLADGSEVTESFNGLEKSDDFLRTMQRVNVDIIIHGHQHKSVLYRFDWKRNENGYFYVSGVLPALCDDKNAGFKLYEVQHSNSIKVQEYRYANATYEKEQGEVYLVLEKKIYQTIIQSRLAVKSSLIPTTILQRALIHGIIYTKK